MTVMYLEWRCFCVKARVRELFITVNGLACKAVLTSHSLALEFSKALLLLFAARTPQVVCCTAFHGAEVLMHYHLTLQAMNAADSGLYVGPLRLLAMEVFDETNQEGVYCDLITGLPPPPPLGGRLQWSRSPLGCKEPLG